MHKFERGEMQLGRTHLCFMMQEEEMSSRLLRQDQSILTVPVHALLLFFLETLNKSVEYSLI